MRERMIGGDFEGSELIPNRDKLWAVIEAAQAICRRRTARPSTVETILGVLTWCFLISRPALSTFSEIYVWCQQFRTRAHDMTVPDEVLRELACAAAVAPLVHADLAAQWHNEVYMYDASELGGAVIATTASVSELRAEARWATRAGWCVCGSEAAT